MRWLVGPAAGLILAGLGGCITLLPKEHPVQLYRFGAGPAAPVPRGTVANRPFTVRANLGSFERASAGDKILTVVGNETSYIRDARWVTPAQSLFEAAMAQRFVTSQGPAELLDRGELAAADYRLDVSVPRFEVTYASQGSAPVVDIEIDASLESGRGPAQRRSKTFEARTPATANRLSAIVAAYDRGINEVLSRLVDWVDAKGGI